MRTTRLAQSLPSLRPVAAERLLVDLKLPIVLHDELTDSVIRSDALLDLASGEISDVRYDAYDRAVHGLPAELPSYEFTSGVLANGEREVEFRVEVDVVAGRYCLTASELLELKGRAAKLFSRPPEPPAATRPRK